jgi:hypothetical protein
MKHLLFLFFSIGCLAQVTDSIKTPLKNSKFILGVVESDFISAGNLMGSSCYIYPEKILNKGEVYFVSGTAKCKTMFGESEELFYSIVHKGKPYFVDKKNLNLKDNVFDSIYNLDNENRIKFNKNAFFSDSLYYKFIKEGAINQLKKTSSLGLAILNHSIYDESEYTSGTGFKISLLNTSKKKIKYLWFNIVAYNSVEDPVLLNGKSLVTLKAVGPIDSFEKGDYSFDYVWFSDLPQTVKIKSIKVQYFDGTFKTIETISKILMNSNISDILFE